MTYRGHVKNGQILLDEPVRLPEGAEVNVAVVPSPNNGKPGALSIVRDRAAHRIRLDAELARQIAALPDLDPNES